MEEKIYCYSKDESSSDSDPILYNFYYYYEFIKPNNNVKYLIMEYQYKIKDGCLIIENTRYRRYFLTIVILSTIGGAIVLIIIAIIIYKVCKKRPSYITNIPLENYERPPTPYPADLDIWK